jgi:hypothetical protein
MTPTEFKRLLRHGLGRAVLYGQANGLLPFRQELWAACVENPAFDCQVEGERSGFLFDLIACSGEPEWYRGASVDLLSGPNDPDTQIYEIVRRFAARGDAEARQVLYDAYARHQPGCALNGDSIIRLDGAAGYRHVIEVVGGTANPRDDAWVRGLLRDEAVGVLGEAHALEVLHAAAAEGSQGKGFLQSTLWERPRPKLRGDDIKGLPFASIADEVGRHGYAALQNWARTASDLDVHLAADALEAEQETVRILALLGVFLARPFPGKLDRLIALGAHTDLRISRRACGAIAQIERADVRAYAVNRIRSGRVPKGVIEALMRNHEPGDSDLVRQAYTTVNDEDSVHHAQFQLVEYVKAHPDRALQVDAFIWFYDRNPCTSMCREEQVEQLIQLDALPDWMAAECLWDANPRVREVVAAAVGRTRGPAAEQSVQLIHDE